VWKFHGKACNCQSDAGGMATGTAVVLSGHWGCISVARSQVVEDASVSRDCRVFEWGLTVNQNQKKDYIRKQLRKDTSSIYKKSTHFFTTRCKTSALDCSWGVVLTKKKLCIPGSLSLSPPLEERARGEVRGSWTLIGSNHPTAIFGQHVPYLASVQIVISSHRTGILSSGSVSSSGSDSLWGSTLKTWWYCNTCNGPGSGVGESICKSTPEMSLSWEPAIMLCGWSLAAPWSMLFIGISASISSVGMFYYYS